MALQKKERGQPLLIFRCSSPLLLATDHTGFGAPTLNDLPVVDSQPSL